MTLLPYVAWIPAALLVSLSTASAQAAPMAPRPAQAFVANHEQWPSSDLDDLTILLVVADPKGAIPSLYRIHHLLRR